MKTASVWVSIALLCAPTVLAQASTTTSAAPSCTASLTTKLCDYPSPGPEFAVAIGSRASCWEYCNAHQPCDFVIFSAGNPNTGTGTCWLYPGKSFDASAGSSNCGNPTLSVYSKPVCAGGSPTSGACASTASPSAIASICGYPPPGDCFYTCYASESASGCLSQCAKADSCSYAVFNPHNPSNSPYAAGSCWVYPNGTYDAGSATTCSGQPEQFVYNNVCPKPSPSPLPLSASSPSPSAAAPTGRAEAKDAATSPTTINKSSAPAALSLSHPLAICIAAFLSQGLW
jgi:hypothetical protein